MFTAQEVKEKVEAVDSKSSFVNEYGYSNLYEYLHTEEDKIEVEGLGTVEHVVSYGGEGQGDDYWVVFSVGDQLFRVDGWYASYDGGELDGEPYEVEAVEVTVTEYRKK